MAVKQLALAMENGGDKTTVVYTVIEKYLRDKLQNEKSLLQRAHLHLEVLLRHSP